MQIRQTKIIGIIDKKLALGTSNLSDNGGSYQNIKFSVHESQHQFSSFLPFVRDQYQL
jgi:hypothetical protein